MLPQNDVHTEFIRKKSRYETRSWLGLESLARPPEADLDGVGICEVAAVVPNPVFLSTGPPDHSPKLPAEQRGSLLEFHSTKLFWLKLALSQNVTI